jgi:hypothetical protein
VPPGIFPQASVFCLTLCHIAVGAHTGYIDKLTAKVRILYFICRLDEGG